VAKLSVLTWIAKAAARLCGRHGAVSDPARLARCSGQTVYDHADQVQHALAQARLDRGGTDRQQFRKDRVEKLQQPQPQFAGLKGH
jgi:hypothetical protein